MQFSFDSFLCILLKYVLQLAENRATINNICPIWLAQTQYTALNAFVNIKHNINVLKDIFPIFPKLPSDPTQAMSQMLDNTSIKWQQAEGENESTSEMQSNLESVCLLSWATGALCHHRKHWGVSVREDKNAALIS